MPTTYVWVPFPFLFAGIRHEPVVMWKKIPCTYRITIQANFLQGARGFVRKWSPTGIYLEVLAKGQKKWKSSVGLLSRQTEKGSQFVYGSTSTLRFGGKAGEMITRKLTYFYTIPHVQFWPRAIASSPPPAESASHSSDVWQKPQPRMRSMGRAVLNDREAPCCIQSKFASSRNTDHIQGHSRSPSHVDGDLEKKEHLWESSQLLGASNSITPAKFYTSLVKWLTWGEVTKIIQGHTSPWAMRWESNLKYIPLQQSCPLWHPIIFVWVGIAYAWHKIQEGP